MIVLNHNLLLLLYSLIWILKSAFIIFDCPLDPKLVSLLLFVHILTYLFCLICEKFSPFS